MSIQQEWQEFLDTMTAEEREKMDGKMLETARRLFYAGASSGCVLMLKAVKIPDTVESANAILNLRHEMQAFAAELSLEHKSIFQ